MRLIDNNMVIIAVIYTTIAASLAYALYDLDVKETTALHLTQCIRAECSECRKNRKEPAALAHCLLKQAKYKNKTLDEQILDYCAIFEKEGNKRASTILDSTTDKPPEKVSREWWSNTLKFSHDFLDGKVQDPLKDAFHFGGDMDHHRAVKKGWIELAKGKYSSRFYALPGKKR